MFSLKLRGLVDVHSTKTQGTAQSIQGATSRRLKAANKIATSPRTDSLRGRERRPETACLCRPSLASAVPRAILAASTQCLMLGTNFVPRAPSRGATGQAACSRRRQVLLVSGFFILVFVTTLLVLASSDISESSKHQSVSKKDTKEDQQRSHEKIEEAPKPPPHSTVAVHPVPLLKTVSDNPFGKKSNKDHPLSPPTGHRWRNKTTSKPLEIKKTTTTDTARGKLTEDLSKFEMSAEDKAENDQRREAVVNAFKDAYHTYIQHCAEHDELLPGTKTCKDWLSMGLTRVDALDTMYLMGLESEFQEALAYIKNHFTADKHIQVSVFESIIRIVGGLLSGYDLTKDPDLLDMAATFARKTFPAFAKHPNTGFPTPFVGLMGGGTGYYGWLRPPQVLGADIGTLQLEFAYLTQHTGDPEFAKIAFRIYNTIRHNSFKPGLYPRTFDGPSGAPSGEPFATLNAWGDSLYEYVFKVWYMIGQPNNWLGEMWTEAENAILTYLQVHRGTYTFAGTSGGGPAETKQIDQAACFAPGIMGLSATIEHADPAVAAASMKFAEGFALFCRDMYLKTPSGLAPEFVSVDEYGNFSFTGPHTFQLRPETVEGFFYLYRITGDKMYRDWAWKIFQNIEKHCKVPTGGYTNVAEVMNVTPRLGNMQSSWFLAETLKYLFLIFSEPTVVPLDKYVFNTEAHPVSIFEPSKVLLDAIEAAATS